MAQLEMDRRLARLLIDDPDKGLQLALRRFGLPVRTICAAILGPDSPQEIEEAVADSFLALWQQLHRYDPHRPLSSWLYGIARRTALNHRRALGRQPLFQELPDEILSGPDDLFDLTDLTAANDNARLLRQALQDLDSPDREIFFRRYYLFQRVKVIAQQLGLPEKTVENRLSRGKKKLRSTLLERGIIL